ncbi:hypothetical protein CDEF62S_00380 [Castellaniella defragrans]
MNYDATELSIRPRLIDYLRGVEDDGAAFISEMFIGDFSRRADLVVANGHLAAYEIKSASDNLKRLEGQIAVYLTYFEYLTIVCASRHVDGVRRLVPQKVGISVIGRDGKFSQIRNPRRSRPTAENLLELLPVSELYGLLRSHQLPVHHRLRRELISQCMEFKYCDIRAFVLSYFKRRADIIKKRKFLDAKYKDGLESFRARQEDISRRLMAHYAVIDHSS